MKSNHARYSLLFFLCIALLSCKDDAISPGGFNYPIDLDLSSEEYGITLEWSRASVSSFEEYIILRSPDSIPDKSEPTLEGQEVVVERIDKIDEVRFTDYSFPIQATHYYKVYARIGERFLMSPTRRIDVDLQLIPLRIDQLVPDQERNEIVAYDRGLRMLFVYDYANDEILRQQTMSMSNPIVRTGTYNGAEEVYVCDRSTQIAIHDRASLSFKTSLWSSGNSIQDFLYKNSAFVLNIYQSSDNIQVWDRANRNFKSAGTGAFNSPTFIASDHEETEYNVIHFTPLGLTKFRITNFNISTVKTVSGPNTNVIMPTRHPERNEFIATSVGQVIDSELNNIGLLGAGNTFYNSITYSYDGRYVAAVRFDINGAFIDIFDSESDYSRVKVIPVNFSPNFLFSDDNYIYATGLVFTGGLTQTVLTRFKVDL